MAKKSASANTPLKFWEERAKLLRVMAHPVRLMILESLCDGPRCVNDLNGLVDIPQPHLSQHIAALRKVGLIVCHINGSLRCYYVIRPTLIRKLIPLLRQEHPCHERDRQVVIREAQKARDS